jgi:hypothetical protein
MSVGIANNFRLAANHTSASATLADLPGFSLNVTLGQKVHVRGCLLVTVGATGGIRLQLVPSAAATTFHVGYQVNNTVAPSVTPVAQVASAAVTNALANAGTHVVWFEGDIVPSATGTIKLQVAQNTTDALTASWLLGSWMETTQL